MRFVASEWRCQASQEEETATLLGFWTDAGSGFQHRVVDLGHTWQADSPCGRQWVGQGARSEITWERGGWSWTVHSLSSGVMIQKGLPPGAVAMSRGALVPALPSPAPTLLLGSPSCLRSWNTEAETYSGCWQGTPALLQKESGT